MAENDELHSFPFEETINGQTHFYRIMELGPGYAVEKHGVFVAEVAHNDQWRQVAGKMLDQEVLSHIYDCIEEHYY
jgi:hypothetical protein